jgi:nardilysin
VPHSINPSSQFQPALHSSTLRYLTRAVSIKKGHKLLLTWQLPPIIGEYQSKSTGYLAHLLGHEGAGSLMAYLKAHSLAHALSAGVGSSNLENSSCCALFTVTIKLTKRGFVNWVIVVQSIFQYLHMLRSLGPQQWIYEEIRDMATITFRMFPQHYPVDSICAHRFYC